MGDSNSHASWKANVRGSYFLCPPGNIRTKALEKARLQTVQRPAELLALSRQLPARQRRRRPAQRHQQGYGIASGSYNTAATRRVCQTAPARSGDASMPPLLAFKKVVSKAGALRLDVRLRRHAARRGGREDDAESGHPDAQPHHQRERSGRREQRRLRHAQLAPPRPWTRTRTACRISTKPRSAGIRRRRITTRRSQQRRLRHRHHLLAQPARSPAYTRLEEYLHFLAIPHGTLAKNIAGTPTTIQVDLRKFTKGFVESPVFTADEPHWRHHRAERHGQLPRDLHAHAELRRAARDSTSP